MENLKVENLKINQITPDANQPRKSIDETHLNGLADSIKKHGVLQPITVRKNGKGYCIVMGERRYRACKLAKLKSIPCVVREFKEEDIFEIQIIENLQRKDVDPIEESEAIAFLKNRYKPEEISRRIGRSINYVYQRIKLGELIAGFKHLVKTDTLSLGYAIRLAAFPAEQQAEMLEYLGDSFREWEVKNLIQNQSCNLEKAPFDVKDEHLLPSAGSCMLCPFNSVNQGNLFGAEHTVCTKAICFEKKKKKVVLQVIDTCKKENTLFVPKVYEWAADKEKNQSIFKLMTESGFTTHLLDDVELLSEPVKPTFQSVKEDCFYDDASDAEIQEVLEEALEEYTQEFKQYNTALDNGYMKGIAFNVDTYESEKVYIRIKSTSVDLEKDKPLQSKKMEECTPKEKIQKLQLREARKKDIESNKLFVEIAEGIKENNYLQKTTELHTDEMIAFCYSAYRNNVKWEHRNDFESIFGNPKNLSPAEFLKAFKKKFKKQQFYKIIRYMILNQLHYGEQSHVNNVVNLTFYTAMQEYYKDSISELETKYADALQLREHKLQERIKALEKEIAEQTIA